MSMVETDLVAVLAATGSTTGGATALGAVA